MGSDDVILLKPAAQDVRNGRGFYDKKAKHLGDCFFLIINSIHLPTLTTRRTFLILRLHINRIGRRHTGMPQVFR